MGIDQPSMNDMSTRDTERIAEQNGSPEELKQDVVRRSEGNPGAIRVLSMLAAKGAQVYYAVAPNLGGRVEIWTKFQDECRGDLDELIEKYGSKAEIEEK